MRMSQHQQDISDEEQLIDLLRLVVTCHPDASALISESFKKTPYLANIYITFFFREKGTIPDHECRCHYEHEYMTYITETGFDNDAFSQMAKNVVNGKCRHVLNEPLASPSTPNLTSTNTALNRRSNHRYSVECDSISDEIPKKQFVKNTPNDGVRSLEMEDSFRGAIDMSLSRSSNSLKSLTLGIDDVHGQTKTSLIHAAAAVGDAGLFNFLLTKAQMSTEQVGKFLLSPLHLAIIKSKTCRLRNCMLRPEICLLDKSGRFRYASVVPATHGSKGHLVCSQLSLIGLCVRMNDMNTLNVLLNWSILSDVALYQGLKEAIAGNSTEAVELLLARGVRPDLDIMKLSASKSADVFEIVFKRFRKDFKIYLIEHPEHITRELLLPAVLTGNIGVVKVLLQNGAPVTCKGFYTPLTLAVLENQHAVARTLLEHHADKSPAIQGCNLLDIATSLAFTDCTDVLRNFGFKRRHRSSKCTVPCQLLLGIAKKFDNPQDLAKIHRYQELKHNHHDEDTVLHVAIKAKISVRLLKELLKMGSNINAKNNVLETPLMCAISKDICSDPEIIRALLYYNPILEQSDKYGKTTLAIAIARDQWERSIGIRKGSHIEFTSSIAPLLLECGYNVKYDSVRKPHHTVSALGSVWKDLAITIGCLRDGFYVQQKPKTLQCRCREVLRRLYPGRRLHTLLQHMKVPPEIIDFVLMASLLKADLQEC